MGHTCTPLAGTQHQLPCCLHATLGRSSQRLCKAQQSFQSRPKTKRNHLCTARQGGAIAETLSSVSLTQTQESVQVLKRTRLITAVKTPYREDGKFDLRAYDAHVESQIAHGVEGLIVGGTTGTCLFALCM